MKDQSASSTDTAEKEVSSQNVINPYESVIITKPTLTDEEIEAILEKVRTIIESKGGELVSSDNWGKKKLAYEVGKERKGIYLFVHFKGPGDTVAELERTYRFSEQIIKFMNIRIEPEELGKSQPPKEDKAFTFRGRDSRGWR